MFQPTLSTLTSDSTFRFETRSALFPARAMTMFAFPDIKQMPKYVSIFYNSQKSAEHTNLPKPHKTLRFDIHMTVHVKRMSIKFSENNILQPYT